MLLCASEPEHQKETKPSWFSFIELKIEEMEEVIEDLESEVEEHDGIIGKGYFFPSVKCHNFARSLLHYT